jgi:hypothetical protein
MADKNYAVCGSCQDLYGFKNPHRAAMEYIRRLELTLHNTTEDLVRANRKIAKRDEKIKALRKELKKPQQHTEITSLKIEADSR